MSDLLGYKGKTVVITGSATGMGASAAEMLVELGAEVWALDINDVKAPVHRAIRTDMSNKESIDAALAEIPEGFDPTSPVRVLSLSILRESGTGYTPSEVRASACRAHERSDFLSLDGRRL